jgi:predicted PurR-regulated permease PerM
MSTLVLFISVLGGIGAFGMLGLVLGPIVVATATSVMDVYVRRREERPAAATGQPADAVLE